MGYNFDCRLFTGYKPCRFKRSCDACPHYDPVESRILIVSLEAMGAVLRSTCLLQPIKRRFPKSHISWVTMPASRPLLDNNPFIDRLYSYNVESSTVLRHLKFDVVYAVDKSLEAGALAETINAPVKLGFGLSPQGIIYPFTEAGQYQYALGLNDHLKFHVNQKPETQQLSETMELEWVRDPYELHLRPEEMQTTAERRQSILGSSRGIIGYNTGCSLLYPYKKLTVSGGIEVIKMWRREFPDYTVALLGGPEDKERQAQMKQAFENDRRVVNTPCSEGLRSGILWMNTADLVFSGCSLGMHIAIALKKPTIAWFGVSCAQEVDLYDRGIKLQAEVTCSPCWKKSCTLEPKCYDRVSLVQVKEASAQLLKKFA